MKGVLRFRCKEKLSLRFIGPFEILERISPVAYDDANIAYELCMMMLDNGCVHTQF